MIIKAPKEPNKQSFPSNQVTASQKTSQPPSKGPAASHPAPNQTNQGPATTWCYQNDQKSSSASVQAPTGSTICCPVTSTKSTIKIKYDVGYQNSLFIRGNGNSLSWEKGTPLTNLSNDEWIWEVPCNTSSYEFKVLINDQQYEQGSNHILSPGESIQYTPQF